ncbi:Cyclin-D1-binding protein 1 [Rhizophlyctis rosea]|nr:Cyclin-D1-binding protein 1 [Rhizophlyctis rosea]
MAPDFTKTLDGDLNSLIDEALKYVEQFAAPPTDETSESFDIEFFKTESVNTAKVLSHTATKLSLTAPAKSKDAFQCVAQIAQCTRHLVALAHSIPISQGRTLTSRTRSEISSLIYDTAAYSNSLLSSPRTLETDQKIRNIGFLPSTGIVWKACDVIQALPSTNAQAVKQRLKGKLELVEDAVSEIEEVLEGEDEDAGGGWDELMGDEEEDEAVADVSANRQPLTESDRNTILKSVVIVKAARMAMKKVLKSLDDPIIGSIDAQDECAKWGEECSNHVDDLVGTIEDRPIDGEAIVGAVEALAGVSVKGLLESGKRLVPAGERGWFDTCFGQICKVKEEIEKLIHPARTVVQCS